MKMPDFTDLLNGIKIAVRPPLETIPVPREHVLEFLTLLQKSREAAEEGGKHAAEARLWSFIGRVIPYTESKNCSINLECATEPAVNILGEIPVETVGKKGVIGAFPVPPEFTYRLLELMDLDDLGPLHRYNLWHYIGNIIPEYAANPRGKWRISGNGDKFTIVNSAREDE